MSSVKINCPKCAGLGITGTVVEAVCTQCTGRGVITVNDTDTIAAVQTNNAAQSNFVVTTPTPVPPAALKSANRGK